MPRPTQTYANSLLFPEVSKITTLDEAEKYIRRLMEYVEELARRMHENTQAAVTQSDVYIATVTTTSTRGTGWYNATIQHLDKDGVKVSDDAGEVLCLTDQLEADEYINSDKQILCLRVSASTSASPLYLGLETFGRATIGVVA